MGLAEILSIIASIIVSAVIAFFTVSYRLGRYTQTVDTMKGDVDTLKSEVKSLALELRECATKLDERTGNGPGAYIRRKTPIALNEKGEEVLKKGGMDAFVLQNKDELTTKIKARNPKTAYDVQVAAKEIIRDLYEDDRFIPLKNFAFNEGLDIEVVFTVMSIYLRDIALPLLGFKEKSE